MNMIILIGLPGSGKTTICNKWFPGYVRISQDELGSREACIKKTTQCLEAGLNVIIDRCNTSKSERKHWIDLALGYNADVVTAVCLEVLESECIARINERKNHPTISHTMSLEEKSKIVYKFARDFESVSLDEGFTNIVITRN